MIRRKGNVYKLDTPATTLLLGAGGEQLYYGGRLAVGGCDYEFLRDESEEAALRPFSAFGGEGPLGISCVLEGRAFFPRFFSALCVPPRGACGQARAFAAALLLFGFRRKKRLSDPVFRIYGRAVQA